MISEGAFNEEADEPPESQISCAVVHDVGDDGEDDEDDDKQDHVEFDYAPSIDLDDGHRHVVFVDDVYPCHYTCGHEDDGTHEVHVNDDGQIRIFFWGGGANSQNGGANSAFLNIYTHV